MATLITEFVTITVEMNDGRKILKNAVVHTDGSFPEVYKACGDAVELEFRSEIDNVHSYAWTYCSINPR